LGIEIFFIAIGGFESIEGMLLARQHHRRGENISEFCRLALRRVEPVEHDLEAVSRLNVALEVDGVGEHPDELDDDVRRDTGLNGGEIETRIDRSGGALVAALKFALNVAREISVGYSQLYRDLVLDRRRE